MSKKRLGGAKLDLVVFYSVFKRLYSSKWTPEGIPEASRASKMSPNASQKHPEDVQEIPRASKKRPGGKKLDFVVSYKLFQATPVHRRHQAGSPNNLPVREVN